MGLPWARKAAGMGVDAGISESFVAGSMGFDATPH
jgi:hypothetical protein